MKIKLIILSFLPILFFNVNAQTVLYNEDFSGQSGKGVVGPVPYSYDTIGMNWMIHPGTSSLTASSDYFHVNNMAEFEAVDVDGDIFWISPEISISTLAAVNISVDIWDSGSISGSEYIKLYYILDGGTETLFETNGNNTGGFGSSTARHDSLFGTTVQIKIKIRNSAGTKKHKFDNITVTENVSNIQNLYDLPDVSSINLKWSDPASTFDEILVVANQGSAILSGQPTGDGTAYTANSVIGTGTVLLGGTVIYIGNGTSTNFTGVIAPNTYYAKVFTRKGTTWSKGNDISIYYNPPVIGGVFITEYARHATISDYGYIELYNNSNDSVNLSGAKMIVINASSTSEIVDLRTDISGTITIPANGFLILNRNRSKSNFESTWIVDLTNTGFPTNYNRTGINNFGNWKFFQLKFGGNENIDDGLLIDQSTERPITNQRVFQLPFGYWNKMGSVADSATPGYFADFENPFNFEIAYNNGWVPNAPSSTTTNDRAVIIKGNATFVDQSELDELTIWSNAGTDITTENVTVNTTLTIESGGSVTVTGSGLLDGYGTIEVKRNGLNTNSDYNIWGTPINIGVDIIGTFNNANPCDIYVFEASAQQYKYDYSTGTTINCLGTNNTITTAHIINDAAEATADGEFDTGRGYFIPGNADSTITFSAYSSALNNGNISVNVYGGVGPVIDGSNYWNLISNPYPSAVSANDFLTLNSGTITNAIYIYEQGLNVNSFVHFNSTDNFNIASCQGFFVDATTTSTGLVGAINFNNSMRNNNNSDFRSSDYIHAIYLKATNTQNQEDPMRIYFDENALEGFDYVYDAHKMLNSYFNLTSVVESKKLIFNGVPELTSHPSIIPLYFNSTSQSMYTFSIDSLFGDFTGKEILLEDRYLNIFQVLAVKDYTFQTDSAEWNDRFYLHIQNTSNSTGIKEAEETDISIITSQDEIIVSANGKSEVISTIQLLDVKGQIISSITGNSSQIAIPVSGISNGVYLVRYTLVSGDMGIQKVVIQ